MKDVSKLVIIRGNSGSGKSTIAKKLKYEMGYGTMLIPQDVVRRDMPDDNDRIIMYDMSENEIVVQIMADIASGKVE